MDARKSIPQFHLYGEDADDQAFDFIHAETLSSRSRPHDWLIEPHSHRYLHQILYLEKGAGELTVESRTQSFGEGSLALIAPTVAHSFSFADDSEGVVIVFTSDVVHGISDTRGTLGDRLAGAERAEIIALEEGQRERFSRMAHRLLDEFRAGKDGAQIAMLSHLALLIVEISRLGLEDERLRLAKPGALDDTVARLKQLVEDNFRHTRNLSAYAEWLAMTPDRLNEHCKKVTGVTAGHLIRQRLLVEAKRELVFTGQSVSEISYSLNFSDPSYFSRFFRKHSGQTPQQFRDGHR